MIINILNKTITSIDFSNTETAWKIEDAFLILEHFKNTKKIVLGGDILTENFEHNYDSWYYDTKTDQNMQVNVDCSIKHANDYLANYIKLNGTAFYIVFVTQD